jgi:adhesin transport system membrane fusion protein
MINMFGIGKKDTDFMSELEAAASLKPAASAMMLLFTITAMIIFIVIWAAVSQIEEITRGQGSVVPSQEIQVVQSLEGGILQELLVREGQLVKKDDIILRISDVQFSSEERGTEAKSLGLRAKKARLEAEASGEAFVLPPEITEKAPQVAANEKSLYDSRQQELEKAYSILDDKIKRAESGISEIEAQINRLYQNRKGIQEELEITRDMVAKRAVPKLDQIRLERELSDVTGDINANAEKKSGLEAELRSAQTEKSSQVDRFRSQALSDLNEVETEISSLGESLKFIGDRVSRAEVRAPVDGIVNNIAITTIGGVIEPAMRLVEIVPVDNELKIVAQVKPSDVAFLHPGQKAKVKITAYDSTIYGRLEGELTRIGANSVTDREGNVFFEIEVRTDKNYLGTAETPLPITPGMVAETEIITGRRTILTYLLKPILRARGRAFTER